MPNVLQAKTAIALSPLLLISKLFVGTFALKMSVFDDKRIQLGEVTSAPFFLRLIGVFHARFGVGGVVSGFAKVLRYVASVEYI